MVSPVLFSTGAAPVATSSRNLVEFKAGKMEMKDKKVHPIKRQGMVYLRQTPDDSLMHFCWKDRQTGVVEDDWILFPDDCEFTRVKECTTGRVYVLKMKSSNKRMFFWMQESRTDRDDEYCKKINEILNNPPRGGVELGGSSSDRDIQSIFSSLTQEQIASFLGSNGSNLATLLNAAAAGRSPSSNSGASASSTASTTNSAPTSATSATGASAGAGVGRDDNNTIHDLRALMRLNSMLDQNDENLMAAMSAQAESSGAASGQQTAPLIDLSTAVNSESLAHLLNDEEFLRQVGPHLPPVTQTSSDSTPDQRKKQFAETIRSSQFRSSLSQFCVALQSGQLGPLMLQFGLSQACVDAANLGSLEAFVRALELHTSTSQAGAPASTGSSDGKAPPSGQPSSESKDKK